jgi:hypothetical protein
MRRTVALSLLTGALLLVPAALSSAMGHGGGGHGGGHGSGHGGGHHGSHGHFHGHGVIVVGPGWGGPWWWDYPPYYYPPYYYPPQVVVEPAPIIMGEQSPQSYWYYCSSAKAYYPTVAECPEVWIKVPPRAQ